MAKINIYFNNKNYLIEESAFDSASAALRSHLQNTMNGSGATISFGGVTYNVDSAKLTTATNEFISHLGTVAGNGSTVTVNGVQYNIDSTKLSDSIVELENVLGNIKPDNKSNIAYGCRYRLASNKNNGYAVMYENGTLESYNADDTLASSVTVQYVVSNDGRTYVNVDGNEFGYVTADGKTFYMLMGEENGEPIYWNWDLEESDSGLNEYGFYYDVPYYCTKDYSETTANVEVTFYKDGYANLVLELGGNVREETRQTTYSKNKITLLDGDNTVTMDVTENGTKLVSNEGDIFVLKSNNENETREVILEEQVIEGFEEDSGVYIAWVLNDLDLFEAGETYIINWDGTEYRYKAIEVEGIVGFGEENYNPFIMFVNPKELINLSVNALLIATTSTQSSHTVAIYKVVDDNAQVIWK